MSKVRVKTTLIAPKSNTGEMAKVTMLVAPWEKEEREREVSLPMIKRTAPASEVKASA
ncbi:hypothetical protein UFOVP233_83 [uncultured Caudovirales phage]|uniref:Uncharacterized protein n=1 Tax=uncultured Caudovirales phage TaxID=2100421 RepID=A0A6J7WQZ6_9CAUD|nr:hypothetical protein UFOVP233_83 [uncultured Caudovirales phage]